MLVKQAVPKKIVRLCVNSIPGQDSCDFGNRSWPVSSHEGTRPESPPEGEPQPVDSADITASGLYRQRPGRRFEPARAVAKWAMYAVFANDDGMSGPRWPRTHMLVANPDWWDLMLLRHLPYQVYNTSYDIAHRCVRTRRWVRTEVDTTCR